MIKNKKRLNERTVFIILALSILLPFVSSTEYTLGTFKKGECVTLKQSCANCTYVNVTSVTYPNSTIQQINEEMTSTSTVYYYDFCSTNTLGEYQYDTEGNPDGTVVTAPVNFYITDTGEQFDISQSIIIIALLGIMGLFLGLGLTFSKEKWKVRSLFFVSSLIIGVIILNSIRIIMGSSNSLSVMGTNGLYLGIILFVFMLLYLFIYATIEVFNYFKKKNIRKWEVGSNA